MNAFAHPLLQRGLALLIAGALCGCRGESEGGTTGKAAAGRLVLTGSSTIAPLISEVAKRFERRHPDLRIDVQTGGSSRGIADARQGIADIGMASRHLNADEQDLVAHQIAADGVAVIVHRDNPVPALSDEQIVAIFTGEIENWRDVGGPDASIVVANKAEGRATLEVFLEHFQLKNSQIEADVVVGDNAHGIKTVAGNPHAIGYVSIGTAVYDAGQGVPIRLLPASGVPPTLENVAAGRFPIMRPLLLVTNGSPSATAEEFIRYCQSEEVHDLVEGQFFVPVGQ